MLVNFYRLSWFAVDYGTYLLNMAGFFPSIGLFSLFFLSFVLFSFLVYPAYSSICTISAPEKAKLMVKEPIALELNKSPLLGEVTWYHLVLLQDCMGWQALPSIGKTLERFLERMWVHQKIFPFGTPSLLELMKFTHTGPSEKNTADYVKEVEVNEWISRRMDIKAFFPILTLGRTSKLIPTPWYKGRGGGEGGGPVGTPLRFSF